MSGTYAGGFFFILNALVYFAVFLAVVRFLVQAMQVDFYNPLVQSIVNITQPVLAPLRKILILPARRLFDYAALAVALAGVLLADSLPVLAGVYEWPGLAAALLKASFGVVSIILDVYWFALLIMVIVSWVAPAAQHPGLELIRQLTEPITEPFRKLIPPVGGLDFSILLVFLVLSALDRYILPAFERSLGSFLGLF